MDTRSEALPRTETSWNNRLPFSTIEEYMLTDDSSAYPMDSVRMLHFTGLLDAGALHAALEALCERHSLLTCRAERKGHHFAWIQAEAKPEFVWQDADATPECLNASGFPVMKRIDLFKEPGVRVYIVVSERENWTKVLLQFHHSVSDGLGEMQVIGELLTHYARITGAIPADTLLQPIDIEKLPLRRKIGWSWLGYFRNYFHTAYTTRLLALGNPNPLFPLEPISRNAECGGYPFLQSLQLTREETSAYVRKAKVLGVTVNDLLLCDFFVTIEAWREATGRDFPKGVSRIMVPMSLRLPIHDGIPAANVVSSVFLDRSKRQITGDARRFLEGIHREMMWAKRHDQKYVFPLILNILQRFPGLLRFFLRSRKCRSTGVLSNLGRVLEIAPVPRNEDGTIQLGSCRLLFIDAAPPIRYKTMISFSALTYASALRLCLRYDHHFMTPADADSFLKTFHEKLLCELG